MAVTAPASAPSRAAVVSIHRRSASREDEGGSDVDAWHRLAEIKVPVTVACGGFDVPFIVSRGRELAGLLPGGRYRELPGRAHQPYLEDPGQVADLLLDALAAT